MYLKASVAVALRFAACSRTQRPPAVAAVPLGWHSSVLTSQPRPRQPPSDSNSQNTNCSQSTEKLLSFSVLSFKTPSLPRPISSLQRDRQLVNRSSTYDNWYHYQRDNSKYFDGVPHAALSGGNQHVGWPKTISDVSGLSLIWVRSM